MGKTPPLYTATMAKVLEVQGKDWEALQVYSHLLLVDPNRQDIRQARDRLEARLGGAYRQRLIGLFEEWIDLLLIQNRIHTLKQLKGPGSY